MLFSASSQSDIAGISILLQITLHAFYKVTFLIVPSPIESFYALTLIFSRQENEPYL